MTQICGKCFKEISEVSELDPLPSLVMIDSTGIHSIIKYNYKIII